MDVPGDPRDNYIPYMAWAGNSRDLVLQHLNRLQNTDDVLLADAQTGSVVEVYREHDDAWVDVVDDLQLGSQRERLPLGKRKGRLAPCVPDLAGWEAVPAFDPGQFDVIHLEGVDPQDTWAYYIASPHNASQRYLYRSRLDGTGDAE